MFIIKRYPNRKLYNTQAKKYINLRELAQTIRDGYDIQVIDFSTGEDLTALTLTQIIFEEEKKQSGLFSPAMLLNMIQSGSKKMMKFQHLNTSFSSNQNVIDAEIIRRIEALVEKGDLEEEAKTLLLKLLEDDIKAATTKEQYPFLDQGTEIEKSIISKYLPTKDDIIQLSEQLNQLSEKIERIKNQQ